MRAIAIGLTVLLCLLYQRLQAQELLPPPAPPAVNSGSAIEGDVSDRILQLTYYRPGPFSQLKDQVDYGALFTTDRQFVATGTLLFQIDSFYIPNFTWAIGPKLYIAWLQGQGKTDVAGIGAGASARLEILHSIGLAVFGDVYYAPEVLIIGPGNRIYEFTGGAEVQLMSNLTVKGGYRYYEFNLESPQPNNRISNTVFLGLRWHFH